MNVGDNIEYLIKKVKFHIRDIQTDDDEIEELILQVIEDVSNDTQIFKRMYGFSVHSDIKLYNFDSLTTMSETVETELSAVTIEALTAEQIDSFYDTLVLPNPVTTQTTYIEVDAQSTYVNLLDIFSEEGESCMHKFKYKGTSEYICFDDEWRSENDLKQFVFVAAVIPHPDELTQTIISKVTSAIIQGVKYYNSDTLEGQADAQVANIYYQRYWQKRQELINNSPTHIFSVPNREVKSRWV